jgi:TPR repeat protein
VLAAYDLGLAYRDGAGVTKDPKEALVLFLSAAEKNHPGALREVGKAYREGNGVKADLKLSLECLEKAADYEDGEALYLLAETYRFGAGVEPDLTKEASYFIRSARSYVPALAEAGRCYYEGEGVEPDKKSVSAISRNPWKAAIR